MNAISRFGLGLVIAAVAIPATVFAGPAPYENAVNKAMHPGKPHVTQTAPRMRGYVQPRMYAQPRVIVQPRVAATPAPPVQERRVFSYEPGQPAVAAPQVAAPQYVAPFRGGAVVHTYENATMKGLGQIR
jgi:hypothetical protein